MRFTLKNKIFILVLVGLMSAFLVSSYIYFKNLENFAKKHTLEISSYDLKIVNHRMEDIKSMIELYSRQFTKDQMLISNLELITKHNNEKETALKLKKETLDHLLNILGSKTYLSVTLFDYEKNMLLFKRNKKDKILTSYDIPTDSTQTSLEKDITLYKPKKLNLDNMGKVKIFDRKDELIFKKVIPIKSQEETIGFLRLSYILNEYNFKEFIKAIDNNIAIISKNINMNNGSLNLTLDSIINEEEQKILKNHNGYFFNFRTIPSTNINLISYIDKNDYNTYLRSIYFDITIFFMLVIFISLLITSIFTNRFITRPLGKLLQGINELKDKKALKIDIKSNDEIGTIAKEFNFISNQLRESFNSLENTKMLLENVLDTVPMSIFIKDKEGKYILVNKLFLKDLNLENESQIIGKNDYELWNEKDAELYRKKDLKIIRNSQSQLNFEEKQSRGDKEHILLTSKMPLQNKNNETIGILGIYMDITEQKRREKKLKEKEKYLLHQSRLAQMGEMITMIAHQWRQPLAAISSTTNTLLIKSMVEGYEKDFFNERLKNINNYSQHLSSTIDDFRNFFKRNKEKQEIMFNTIAEDSLRIMQTSMESANIIIIKKYKDKKKLRSYPNELRQVVLNLIKNAEDILVEKKGQDKWVKIETYEEKGKHVLSIEDNGGGIPEKIKDKIFEPYFSTKETKDGTGLGLYMSKSIIEDHCKGKLTVENNSDGAVFKIIL